MTLEEQWARCKDWIEAALSYGGDFYNIDDVWDLIRDPHDDTMLWPGRGAAVVTQVWNFPRHKALHYWLCGGDMAEMLNEMQPVMEAWARANGCNAIISAGRKGWERTLAPYGHKLCWVALRKDL